jgi:hypothetical protein
MKDQGHQELVCKARTLYRQAQEIQNAVLDMFFDDFVDLDEQENERRRKELQA